MNKTCSRDNDKEGILTSIFGPHVWEGTSCMTFNYPHNPTEEDKQQYRQYFESLCNVLPCSKCRNHYKEHLYNNEKTKLTEDALENRRSLTYWWFQLHTSVNDMLDIKYNINYEDYCKRYESFIANCKMSANEKAIVYKNYYNKEAPYLDYNLAVYFKQYAEERGFQNFEVITKRDAFSNEWIHRNDECWKIIKNMRISGITCFEKDGKYKDLPTIEELHLIQLSCTTMTTNTVHEIIKKMYNLK